MPDHTHTLTRHDYLSDEVFEIERERIFHRGWFLVGRGDPLLTGNRRVVDVAGESVLVVRDLDGTVRAFANVCRHRGAKLCDGASDSRQGSVMCPYHAWTYALDGALIATPHLSADEVDRSSLPLWQYHAHEWEGFLFVSLAADPPPFDEWLADDAAELLRLGRFRFGELVVGARSECDIAANWKIVVENYQECLHCALVHPELVEAVPIYRTGWVTDRTRDDGGVTFVSAGGFAFDRGPQLPLLPGVDGTDATSYYGGTIFPNGFIDVAGSSAILSTLYPKGPHCTTMVMEYLFAPDTLADPSLDISGVVEFNDLVAAQDNMVCERVHQGVSSKAFTHGVLTTKDEYVVHFTHHYLQRRGPLD